MVEMKRILFLTDFAPEADAALQYAKELAAKFNGQLLLLHVIVDPTSKLYEMEGGDYHTQDANARQKAQEWLARIHREQLGSSPECETLIERGELFEHVLRVVQEKHVDVVALSAHTHPGFHLHLISSLPEKLVRQAPCHVFVIHNAR
jgi:nucleotide-binding universal stress UspA family protein